MAERDRSEPQPGFSEAAPKIGVTQIEIPGVKPKIENNKGEVLAPGNLGEKRILDLIHNVANEKPWIKDIFENKRKAAMVVGAGVITFIVGVEIVQHREQLEQLKEELQKRWKK